MPTHSQGMPIDLLILSYVMYLLTINDNFTNKLDLDSLFAYR